MAAALINPVAPGRTNSRSVSYLCEQVPNVVGSAGILIPLAAVNL